MKIYLAARYSRREEMCNYARELKAAGHTIVSRWIQGNHQVDAAGLSNEAPGGERERLAIEDRDDLLSADLLIAFTEEPRKSNSRGGRHVEFGIALGRNITTVVVGPRENVFCCLPEVQWYRTWYGATGAAFRLTGGRFWVGPAGIQQALPLDMLPPTTEMTNEANDQVNFFEDVRAFHEKFGVTPTTELDHQLPQPMQVFKIKHLIEELIGEYCRAVGYGVYILQEEDHQCPPVMQIVRMERLPAWNAAEVFDCLIDLVYVALGTAYVHRFPFTEGWKRVHAANMAKERATSTEQSKRGSQLDVIKPPGWIPPFLKDLV